MMKSIASLLVLVVLLSSSASSAFSLTMSTPQHQGVGWSLPSSTSSSSSSGPTRLNYRNGDDDGICEETLKSAITNSFHTHGGFTSEQMVWELAPLLPCHAKLDITWTGNIARVQVFIPPTATQKGTKRVFTTFLEGSIEDMKTNVVMHFDEEHYNIY